MGIDFYAPVKGNEAVACVLLRNDTQEMFRGKKKKQCS